MTTTNIDVDDDLLQRAMRAMGARTKWEAVNTALAKYPTRADRVRAFDELLRLGRGGAFEPTRALWQTRKGAQRRASDEPGADDLR